MVSNNPKDRFELDRIAMVNEQLVARNIRDAGVLGAFTAVPREEFVPLRYQHTAYADMPLPIGHGQTISQPYIAALMTERLEVQPSHHVLEVGTGCGYQTSILARLAAKVATIEIVGELSEAAQATLGRLGVGNVEFCVGDGSLGWPGGGTFERIIVTAAAVAVMPAWIDQLAPGGIMVLPLGSGLVQELTVVNKDLQGGISHGLICSCRFVPLVSGEDSQR